MSFLYDDEEIQIPDAAHLQCYRYNYLFHCVHLFQKCQSWHGWGCIQAGVVLFKNQLLTGVLLLFEWGEVLFKSGVVFARMR